MTQSHTSHSGTLLRHGSHTHCTTQRESHGQDPGTEGPLLNRGASLQRHGRSCWRRVTRSRASEDRGRAGARRRRPGRASRDMGTAGREEVEARRREGWLSPGGSAVDLDKIQLTSRSPLAGSFIGEALWGAEVKQEAGRGRGHFHGPIALPGLCPGGAHSEQEQIVDRLQGAATGSAGFQGMT